MTKSKINRLGKKIRKDLREGKNLEETDLFELQDYRTSFKEDISPVFNLISSISRTERKDSIVSFRIKRIESILSKIKREPTMALGNMGDIAGCRVILYTERALKNLIEIIQSKFIIKNFNDYTINPKEDGYTGYHIYIESPINKNKTIEIQLRTIITHKWASLVEIIDILFNLKLKEGQKHPGLQKFLYLLSLPKDKLTIDDKKSIIDVDKEYDIYPLLNGVFIKNHISIRKSWIKLSETIENYYFIIEVDENKKSNIISINNYKDAEEEYFKMFRTETPSNFVLAYIERPNFKKICVAYASYMMVKHDYLNDWSNFVKDIIDYDLMNKKKESFNLYKDYFKRNLNNQVELISNEIKEVKQHIDNNGGNQSFGVREWLNELKDRNTICVKFTEEVQELKKSQEKGLWNKIFG